MLDKKTLLVASLLAITTTVPLVMYHQTSPVTAGQDVEERDWATLSNVDNVTTIHAHLNYTINFTGRKIFGSNMLTMQSMSNSLDRVDLDIQGLNIFNVLGDSGERLEWEVRDVDHMKDIIGLQLRIKLGKVYTKGKYFNLTVFYETNSTTARAFSWLNPEQTAGKKHPYLFTQCETIYCRSVAPFQDTPQVKFTYSAEVRVPDPLSVNMSANVTGVRKEKGYNVFNFELRMAIPSYLIAIVAGNLQQVQVGARTHVITEPEMMPEVAKELEHLEVMLQDVESYITPYAWGTYRIVVLPPSFPIGGMENPLLTFASPTIIVGDKANINVAIHEICHSWTGNGVTNKNWESFWLNEGFTMFLQRKGDIVKRGKDVIKVDMLVGYQSMLEDMNNYGMKSNFTSLSPKLKGHNPDDAFSTIPYEKGFQFASYMEYLCGEGNFQKFMKSYVKKFEGKSITSRDYKDYFTEWVQNNLHNQSSVLRQIDWETWLFAPGEPIWHTDFNTTLVSDAQNLSQKYIDLKGGSPADKDKWFKFEAVQKTIFMNHLLEKWNQTEFATLERIFQDYKSDLLGKNWEFMTPWLRVCIRKKWNDRLTDVDRLLGTVGRQKFILPAYMDLVAFGFKDYARAEFEKYKNFYHPLAYANIKRIVEGDGTPAKVQTVQDFEQPKSHAAKVYDFLPMME